MTEQSDEVATPPISEFDKDYNLNKLTPDERKRMMKNILDGQAYIHIDVIENKNCTFRLTRKKAQSSKTTRKRIVADDDSDDDNIRVHLTPTQQLLEFAFEKIGKLEGRNKKRKQQLNEIYSLFNDYDEGDLSPAAKLLDTPPKIEKTEEHSGEQHSSETPKERSEGKPKPGGISNLRSRLKYLN